MGSSPRKAASVILLRRCGKHNSRGLEVLMVKRNPSSRVMPGVWVFPGGTVDEADGHDFDLAHKNTALRELEEETGIKLKGTGDLIPFSHWITPTELDVRYDVYFFTAIAPAHSPPQPDGEEVVEAQWFTPQRALELQSQGQMPMVFPTIKHLEELSNYPTSDDLIASAPQRQLDPIQPKVVDESGRMRIILPGEAGYDRD